MSLVASSSSNLVRRPSSASSTLHTCSFMLICRWSLLACFIRLASVVELLKNPGIHVRDVSEDGAEEVRGFLKGALERAETAAASDGPRAGSTATDATEYSREVRVFVRLEYSVCFTDVVCDESGHIKFPFP